VAIVDELDEKGVAAIAGEYHSVAARAIAARATQLGVAFVCSSAVLDSLTDEPSQWVARLAPAQSHCWRAYAEFLVEVGYRRVALITQPDRYWSTGAEILRAVLGEAGVMVVSVDASATDAADAAAQLAEIGGIAAAVLLVAYPEPAASLVRAFRASGALADPRPDPLHAGARGQRLAVGLAANPGRRPSPGTASDRRPARAGGRVSQTPPCEINARHFGCLFRPSLFPL
jgi:receptor family ligand binding protein